MVLLKNQTRNNKDLTKKKMLSVAGVLAEQVSQLQRDKQQLNDEIKAVRDSRAETEAHVQK